MAEKRTRLLTDLLIRQARAPARGQVEIWDDQLRGLALRVSQGGTKSFVIMYYFRGRHRRMTLGRYPSLTLAGARADAARALQVVAEGGDPALKSATRGNDTRDGFAARADEFVQKYARLRNRGWRETQRILEREFVATWDRTPVESISKKDVIEVIDRIVARGSPGSAGRCLAIIRKFFNWCIERGLIATSPCLGLRAPVPVGRRDRVLSDNELTRVWRASEAIGYPYGKAVQLLVLTGQRKGEVIGAKWEEFDFASGTWTIDAARNKSNRQHVVPLSSLALDIIKTMPRVHEAWLFPSISDAGVVSGFSKWKDRLDERSGVSNWRLHDLRRSTATGMASLGVSPHVIERILNHTGGILGGVAGIYNRFQYLPEMRRGLDSWASHVRSLTEHAAVATVDVPRANPAQVIPIKA